VSKETYYSVERDLRSHEPGLAMGVELHRALSCVRFAQRMLLCSLGKISGKSVPK